MKTLPIIFVLLLLDGCGASDPYSQRNGTASKTNGAETTEPTMNDERYEKAMFGAGCFWGVEHTFAKVDGVVDTAVGYSGGQVENPTYRQVCSDTTGHAEVVLITYDPAKVGYDQLVNLFFQLHNPTQLNRQGPDIGAQYRSAVFYYNDEQKQTAELAKQTLADSGKYSKPIVTEISEAEPFWRAEEYHQHYLKKKGVDSCRLP